MAPSQDSPKFFITRLEPTRYRDALFGKQIEFNREKQYIRFYSNFHDPDILPFTQVERISVEFDKKMKLFWWALGTFLLGIGIILFIIRIRLPPWKIRIWIKKQPTPVKIRAWMDAYEGDYLTQLCQAFVPVDYTPQPQKN